jgi:hypothetical protein
MQDWVGLLIAFVLGFFMKSLMGTLCHSRLVEGEYYDSPESYTLTAEEARSMRGGGPGQRKGTGCNWHHECNTGACEVDVMGRGWSSLPICVANNYHPNNES